jgi:hypothetical protein
VSLDQVIVQSRERDHTAHGNVIRGEDLARWRSDCGGEGEEDLGREGRELVVQLLCLGIQRLDERCKDPPHLSHER